MKSDSDALLVDTNLLIYMYDPRDRRKQERARQVVDRLVASRRAAVSVQCLTEFFSTATRRLPEPLTLEQALARVETLTRVCRVFDLTALAVLDGCHAAAQYQLSIWDALIWAVARLNGVPCIVTEDSEHGRVVGGIRYLNPFADSFDLDVLAV